MGISVGAKPESIGDRDANATSIALAGPSGRCTQRARDDFEPLPEAGRLATSYAWPTPRLMAAYLQWLANDRKQAARRNEVGSLDFDPFLDAQDWDVTAFDIVVSDEAAGKAQATVKFINQGQAMTVVLDLVQVKNAWRIYDITWSRGNQTETLRKIFVH
jgi:Protein of unknown function (DUF3828)